MQSYFSIANVVHYIRLLLGHCSVSKPGRWSHTDPMRPFQHYEATKRPRSILHGRTVKQYRHTTSGFTNQ